MALLFEDTFTAADGTALDTTQWTFYPYSTDPTPTVLANRLRSNDAGTFRGIMVPPAAADTADGEIYVEYAVNNTTGGDLVIGLRTDGLRSSSSTAASHPNKGLYLRWAPFTSTGGLTLYKAVPTDSVGTSLGTVYTGVSPTNGMLVSFRIRFEAARVQARAWRTGTTEPTTWHIDHTLATWDTTLTKPFLGYLNGQWDLDSYRVANLAADAAPPVYKLKAFNGTAWVQVKRHDGTGWVPAAGTPRRHDGAAWQVTDS